MKIALVFPKVTTMAIVPNLGFGYLAAVLLKNNFKVKIFRCDRDNLKLQQLIQNLNSYKPDIVGIQSFSFFHNDARRLAKHLKSEFPHSIMIIGGCHASGVKELVLIEEKAFDFGFAGESEIGFVEFMKQLAGKNLHPENIPGLIWRDGNNCICNEIKVVKNLDILPFPPWNKMEIDKYPNHAYGTFSPGFPIVPMLFSRGCNFNCDFCAGHLITGFGIRYRSVENLIGEIEFICGETKVRTIAFLDQNFTANRKAVLDLCDLIIKSSLDIKWYCPNGVHPDSLDDYLLQRMRAAGCEALTIGIESASNETLKLLHRNSGLENMYEKIQLINKNHIRVTGNFMLGLPNEKENDFKNIIRKSLNLPLDRAQFAFFVPLPGTPLFKQFFPIVNLQEIDWDMFDITLPYFVKTISKVKASFYMLLAFLLFYIRPKVLYKSLKDVKSFQHFEYIILKILNVIFALRKIL